MNPISRLQNIIAEDYCIGCGLCAPISKGTLEIKINEYGFYRPYGEFEHLDLEAAAQILKVCPFSDDGDHEDEIASSLFKNLDHDSKIGHYREILASCVTDENQRFRASSGGIVTWLLNRLMDQGQIDGVLHVADEEASNMSTRYFRYKISRSREEILNSGKSKYYPIEMSEVVSEVLKTPGRYAVVGTPCYIKALRRLAVVDERVGKRLVYYIGIVCGHLKSKAFAEAYVLASGGDPKRVERFEFRTKSATGRASNYLVQYQTQGEVTTLPANNQDFADWSLGAFKYNACDFCDDVFAETSDLVVGDAWLPEYLENPQGMSLIISRNEYLSELLRAGQANGDLASEPLTVEQAAQSQAGGLRHRRRGLAYRTKLRTSRGYNVPKKRNFPLNTDLSFIERISQRSRMFARKTSLSLWIQYGTPSNWHRFKRRFYPIARLNKAINLIKKKWVDPSRYS